MPGLVERITLLCFGASYAVALGLELAHLFRPRPVLRLLGLGFGAAGFLAHTVYVVVQPLNLASSFGSLLFLAWILAVFYLYGSVHHRRLAWGLFVLPLVLGLVVLARLAPQSAAREEDGFLWRLLAVDEKGFWGMVHGGLVLLAAVGICVGFIASLMYLVQVRRLRAKLPPGRGVRMFSLERIEEMNRRAILWSFPLLTLGLVTGMALQWHNGDFLEGWASPKILGALGLWVVFAILLYLRYATRARGGQVAWLTVVAFALMLFALLAPVHPFAAGGGP